MRHLSMTHSNNVIQETLGGAGEKVLRLFTKLASANSRAKYSSKSLHGREGLKKSKKQGHHGPEGLCDVREETGGLNGDWLARKKTPT